MRFFSYYFIGDSMLRKMSIKKLVISGIVLFSIFLICLIPNKEEEKLEVKQELEYVDKDVNTHNIFLLDSDNYLVQTDIVISETKDIEKKAKELLTALIEGSSLEDKIKKHFVSVAIQIILTKCCHTAIL